MTSNDENPAAPEVSGFFDEATNTISYVVADPVSRTAVIIDPVLDFDMASGRTGHSQADRILDVVRERKLSVDWILETHVHADHLTAAPYLQENTGGRVAIGAGVKAVQAEFSRLFNTETEFVADGSQFDRLLEDGDHLDVGDLALRVLATPGHTPACVTFVIGNAAFVGDTLFMPDFGTARTDFPGGDAGTLFRSIRRILDLPDDTRLFMCHDYKAPGRDEYAWETSVHEQRRSNIHVHDGVGEAEFIAFRTTRDRQLAVPKLLLPSVQVNMRAGRMPPAESNGSVFLKLPINCL